MSRYSTNEWGGDDRLYDYRYIIPPGFEKNESYFTTSE